MEVITVNIESIPLRAKTAMERYDFSRPVKLALLDQIITPERTIFDYGCGKGSDVEFLTAKGYQASGWDPFFHPESTKVSADVVNLGYVINVIEDPYERVRVIKDAYSLAKEVLVISAQSQNQKTGGAEEFGDGYITKSNTFQKYFSQDELKELITVTLGKSPYPTSQGIFYVFKSEKARVEYLTNRYDSTKYLIDIDVPFERIRKPRVSYREERLKQLFENDRALELVQWVSRRGRMPRELEFEGLRELCGEGISYNALQSWVIDNVDEEAFLKAQSFHKNDILLMLATLRLDPNGRPKLGDLPEKYLHDIKEFFKSYKNACEEADKLLFSLGNPETIKEAIKVSEIGKKLPDSIYVHRSAIPYLPDVLQLFIACGKTLVGDLEGDVIVKIPKKANGVSFLLYKNFDSDDHPELLVSIKADFKIQRTFVRDYSQSDNPPILHRKETFVHKSYPWYSHFSAVTEREESLGLLSRSDIGFKKQWDKVLKDQ